MAKTKTTQNGRSKSTAKANGTSGATRAKRQASAKATARSAKPETEIPAPAGDTEVKVDQRRGLDRRKNGDRRKRTVPVAVERRQIERRVKVNRRRQIDPTTCERDYTVDEIEFMSALDEYKRTSGRMFPTCSEILEVIKNLGYEKCPEQPAAEAASRPESELPAPTASSKA